jgi:hypothetical protein
MLVTENMDSITFGNLMHPGFNNKGINQLVIYE